MRNPKWYFNFLPDEASCVLLQDVVVKLLIESIGFTLVILLFKFFGTLDHVCTVEAQKIKH